MTIGSPHDVIAAAEVLGAAGMCNIYGSSETGGKCCVTHHDWPLAPDGWFQSGDIGQLTEAGEMVFLGRSTEMIKRAGINVSPAEVEDVLLQHPGVAQAGVVGAASEKGETIVAFVVPRAGATLDPAELTRHCRALASSYKVPDRFEIRETLPTTVTGKLMRKDLKATAAQLPQMTG